MQFDNKPETFFDEVNYLFFNIHANTKKCVIFFTLFNQMIIYLIKIWCICTIICIIYLIILCGMALAKEIWFCRPISWFLYEMVAQFTLRTYDVNKVFFRKKKIEFDDSLDVTKCLQQIEMPDLLHVFA